ncbi:MAG: hypothetical protein OXQ84_20380 [bacterium]|nr:hypothetical protein [bacterium]
MGMVIVMGIVMAMATVMVMATATEMATGMETNSSAVRLVQSLSLLLIGASLLTACAATSSEVRSVRECPSLISYSAEIRERAADEIALLPEDSAIIRLLSDYTVMRDQTRACKGIAAKS